MKIILIAVCIHVALSKPTQSPRTLKQTGDRVNHNNKINYYINLRGGSSLSYDANLDRPSYSYNVKSSSENKEQSGVIETDVATGEKYLSVQGTYSYANNGNNRVSYIADKNGYIAKFIFGKDVADRTPVITPPTTTRPPYRPPPTTTPYTTPSTTPYTTTPYTTTPYTTTTPRVQYTYTTQRQTLPTTKGVDPTLLQCAIGSGCLK